MPRLLTNDWIKIVAINHLLQLYEQNGNFVKEWGNLKKPFMPMIEQFGRFNTLAEVEYMLMICPPDNIVGWVPDLQKLRNYLGDLQVDTAYHQSSSLIITTYNDLLERLAQYVSRLNKLASDWKLRAPWAVDELIRRDVQQVQQDVLNAAGTTNFYELSNKQIHRLVKHENGSLPSDMWPINILSLYLSGGRRGNIQELNNRLIKLEQELKTKGVKEIPSSLSKHAEWWFDHYVNNRSYIKISNGTIGNNNDSAIYPENIRNAISRFSELINIEPIART